MSDSMPFTNADVEAQLQRILQSNCFRMKPACASLLQYIVEQTLAGNFQNLKQGHLLTRFFGEKITTKGEPPSTVKVGASNLRKALEEYYAQENDDPIRIDVPKGAYIATFSSLDEEIAREAKATALQYGSLKTLCTVTFAGVDPTEELPLLLQKWQEVLRGALANHKVEIIYQPVPAINPVFVRRSSVLLFVECTSEGTRWLVDKWETGELDRALGYAVESVRTARSVELELKHANPLALQSCESTLLDVRVTRIDALKIHLENINLHAGATTVLLKLRQSGDLRQWREVFHRELTLPSFIGSFSYNIEFSKWGAPPIIVQPPGYKGPMHPQTGRLLRSLPRNSYWETQLMKFARYSDLNHSIRGGWLAAEIRVLDETPSPEGPAFSSVDISLKTAKFYRDAVEVRNPSEIEYVGVPSQEILYIVISAKTEWIDDQPAEFDR